MSTYHSTTTPSPQVAPHTLCTHEHIPFYNHTIPTGGTTHLVYTWAHIILQPHHPHRWHHTTCVHIGTYYSTTTPSPQLAPHTLCTHADPMTMPASLHNYTVCGHICLPSRQIVQHFGPVEYVIYVLRLWTCKHAV